MCPSDINAPCVIARTQAGNSPEFPALGEGVLGMRSGWHTQHTRARSEASLHKVSDNFSRRRATGAHHPAQSLQLHRNFGFFLGFLLAGSKSSHACLLPVPRLSASPAEA